jgi:aerobic carbon-monoxide dehydrogenase large subunit
MRFQVGRLAAWPPFTFDFRDADVNFRGVGEGGMIVAPPTVVNAIEDALSPFGVRIYEQHLPPALILELIAVADPGQ